MGNQSLGGNSSRLWAKIKPMKKLLLFPLLLFVIQFGYTQAFQDTIPFRNDLGLIIIPVSFNGQQKQMVFDTGADVTLAYGWADKELRRTSKTLRISSSSNLKSRMRYYKSGVIKLGSRTIRKHRILSAPKNTIFQCYRIDGILGTDLIKLLNWKIDYKNKRLIMYPPNHIPKEIASMHALDFSFKGKRPYVYMSRKQSRFQFLLDTGASGSSNISTRQYNLTGLDKLTKLRVYSGTYDVNGIFSKGDVRVFRFPEYTSDEVKLNPVINYNAAKSSKIGNRLWAGKSLFLNLSKARLWVSSDSIKDKSAVYSGSVSFQKGAMRIMGVVEGSALWKAGIRQGDQIAAFNGKKYNNFCELDKTQRKLYASGKGAIITLMDGRKMAVKKISLAEAKQ